LHLRSGGPAMFLASIAFRAQPYKRSEILSAVDVTVERIRHSPGCGRCRLLVDTEDPNAFTLLSEWRVARDAEAFFESSQFQIFKGIRILLREEAVMILDEVQSRVTRVIQAR
jgi:quinol monooxygenase YgiN